MEYALLLDDHVVIDTNLSRSEGVIALKKSSAGILDRTSTVPIVIILLIFILTTLFILLSFPSPVESGWGFWFSWEATWKWPPSCGHPPRHYRSPHPWHYRYGCFYYHRWIFEDESCGMDDPEDIDFNEILSDYGEWIYLELWGWTWCPYASSRWRPYRCGYWSWTRFGWTWTSYEPWGWITHHYGRWIYNDWYGWLWVPGSVWGPAWVTWCRLPGGYIGWAPMVPGCSCHPHGGGCSCFTHTTHYTYCHNHYHYSFSSNYWTVVDSRHLCSDNVAYHSKMDEGLRHVSSGDWHVLQDAPSRERIEESSGRRIETSELTELRKRMNGEEIRIYLPRDQWRKIRDGGENVLKDFALPSSEKDFSAGMREKLLTRMSGDDGEPVPARYRSGKSGKYYPDSSPFRRRTGVGTPGSRLPVKSASENEARPASVRPPSGDRGGKGRKPENDREVKRSLRNSRDSGESGDKEPSCRKKIRRKENSGNRHDDNSTRRCAKDSQESRNTRKETRRKNPSLVKYETVRAPSEDREAGERIFQETNREGSCIRVEGKQISLKGR